MDFLQICNNNYFYEKYFNRLFFSVPGKSTLSLPCVSSWLRQDVYKLINSEKGQSKFLIFRPA